MRSYLYHKDLGLPASIKTPCFTGKLNYSRHALAEARSDRYGLIPLPEEFNALETGAQLIEVEAEGDSPWKPVKVLKQVWRQALDDTRDLVLVVQPDGFVRTVWVNVRTDAHRTLNKAKYVSLTRY